MRAFMVERYLPGVDYDHLADAVTRAASAAVELTLEGRQVTYLGSTFVPAEEACFCRFEACELGAVEEANRRAEAPFWRVVEAVFIERGPARRSTRANRASSDPS
jgi:uncharacterized protein DUF4242